MSDPFSLAPFDLQPHLGVQAFDALAIKLLTGLVLLQMDHSGAVAAMPMGER